MLKFNELTQAIADKLVIFAGQSGVGKSTPSMRYYLRLNNRLMLFPKTLNLVNIPQRPADSYHLYR